MTIVIDADLIKTLALTFIGWAIVVYVVFPIVARLWGLLLRYVLRPVGNFLVFLRERLYHYTGIELAPARVWLGVAAGYSSLFAMIYFLRG